MPRRKSPRILVADDDLGVIAAYRYVLEGDDSVSAARKAEALEALSEELFGKGSAADCQPNTWRIDFVDQGEDAVEAVRKAVAQSDPYNMIFLDIRMPPGLDGYETAQRIREIDGLVYIVFVSAYSDYTREELTDVAGGDYRTGFLCKPVWPHQLMSAARARCGGQISS